MICCHVVVNGMFENSDCVLTVKINKEVSDTELSEKV